MDIVSWTFEDKHHDLDRPIYIDSNDPTRSISTRQSRTLVRQLVSGFQNYGIQRGDCVCVMSFNEIHYTSLYLGIIGSGASFTGANPGYTARELAHHIKITNAKTLLTELKTLPVVIAAAEECRIPQSNIFILNYKNEPIQIPYQSWKKFLQHGEKDWATINDPNATAAFVSTSGTSGLPKAAILPHSYLVSQGKFQETMIKENEQIAALIAVPPFHVFTMPAQHALPLRTCTPAYIMPRFEDKSFISALGKYQITQTLVVPPILMALTRHTRKELDSLRKVFVGGSVTTGGMQQQLYSQMHPDARIVQVYGMTEVGWATTWTREEKDESGSVGQALPSSTLRVVNGNGHLVAKDEEMGEVQIYCPSAMRGYLNNPTATAETFTPDGWIRTGDIGYVKNDNWYIVDRTKDLIKVRGWQVSPAEIEAALLEHPDVVDAGVIGIPADDGCGQAVSAFIKTTPGSDLDLKGVRTFLATILARYKNVEKVEFVDTIPRNPTGKILRRVLRETSIPDPPTQQIIAAEQYKAELQKLQRKHSPENSVSTVVSTVVDVKPSADVRVSMTDSTITDNAKGSQMENAPVEGTEKKEERGCLAPFKYLWTFIRR